jgi:hypothetical protein
MRSFRVTLALILFAIAGAAPAQNTTRDQVKGLEPGKGKTCKILVIPFDPKLYMSEVDKKVGTEAKMNFNQLRATFRTGLDHQVAAKLGSLNTTYSLLSDTVKNKKDLDLIYHSISYDYDKPNPDGAVSKNSGTAKQQPAIQNGQLMVEMSDDSRFMNTKLTNPQLLPYLLEKYNAEVFVFINELDIKKNEDSYDIATDTYLRDVIVHYTVFDKTGKRINAGIAKSSFSSSLNEPKTIINTAFPSIAKTIADRVSRSASGIAAPVPVKDPLKQK